MNQTTVSDVILEQLKLWGVRRIYAVAGDTILHFFDRIAHHPELQLITTHHESAAAFMASADAKLTGQLTVCVGHNGPGVANLINGLGDAYTDRCPVLVLTGQVERWNMGTNYKQYIHQQGLLQAVSSFSELVASPESLVDLMTMAMRTALTQGTVCHLVIPKDIFPMTAPDLPRPFDPFLTTGPESNEALYVEVVQRLQKSRKPVILTGRGAIMARKQVIEFAEKLGAALICTLPARGLIPATHPYNLGGLGHAGSEASTQALKAADLAIILGATWWPYDYVPKHLPLIQVDANPANLGSSKAIEFGLVGKLENVLPRLTKTLPVSPNQSWVNEFTQLKSSWEARMTAEAANLTSPLQPQTIIEALNKIMPENAVISLDVGDHVVWFNRSFKAANQQILVSGRWRSMGFGLPAAAAAALVYPDRPVVCITGDGGLSMSLAELATLKRYNLPVKVFVLNNGALAMEMNRMKVENLTPTGVDLTNPDFAATARACGLAGFSIMNPNELNEVLTEAFLTNGPALVDIQTAATIPPHTKL